MPASIMIETFQSVEEAQKILIYALIRLNETERMTGSGNFE